jgi:hypothetical protein
MRKLGVLLAAGVLLFSAASCTTKKAEDVSAGSPSTEATNNDNGAGTSTTRRSTTTTERTTDSSASDGSDIPALGDLGDCLEVSLTYATLFIGATFATDDQKAELEQQLDQIKGKVPPDIRDDMDTISQGLADANSFTEYGQFLDSQEFKDANANIEQYFEETCGTGSGSAGN